MTNSTQRFLSVMSYNIKYATEEDGENSWSKRKGRLKEVIKKYAPAILGVQEARVNQLQFLEKGLDNYKFFGSGREGKDEGLFNAMFYDAGKFEVLQENTFWLSETPAEPSTGWDAAFPRICTFGLFLDKKTGTKCWIFNTHFDHQGEKAVAESARLIIKRIEQENEDDHPVILMGDFNLESDSHPIRFLSAELNDSRQIAEEVTGPDKTFNAYEYHEPLIARLDYMFVSTGIRVMKYAVLTDSHDEKYPSDHFPLLLELQLG